MPHSAEFILPPEIAYQEAELDLFLKEKSKTVAGTEKYRLVRRSLDARSREIKVLITAEFYGKDEPLVPVRYLKPDRVKPEAKRVLVIGAGPAGLFAALKLLELGFKPLLIERGKDVRSRRRDLAAINKEHIVDEDSNYCFGEGGAGTYSDGKLYTRSSKRGDVRRILEIMTVFGAREEILIDAHPHIGTNKLPVLIQNMREGILEAGGEIYFDQKVTDFILQFGEIKGVITADGNRFEGHGVILATGHSARDIFYLLQDKKIQLEQKPFALGVRVEHQQKLIDKIQYKCEDRGEWLPAASYSLVSQEKAGSLVKGVFSFCMCPGGFIVPSATRPGEVVVNGMSPSRRDSKFSNSGIVVEVSPEDTAIFSAFGPLAGLRFQEEVEKTACTAAGHTQAAPAQRLVDFVNGKLSASLPETSYQPGITSIQMKEVLPAYISEALRKGFQTFGQKMNGYLTNEAVILGVESRTSSPVRIPRDRETFEHVTIRRLFPCGEGAGYAGGIVSAAMDGENCAEKWAEKYGKISAAR